jgi:hypothetical protein
MGSSHEQTLLGVLYVRYALVVFICNIYQLLLSLKLFISSRKTPQQIGVKLQFRNILVRPRLLDLDS